MVKVKAPKKVKPVDTLQVPDSELFSGDAEKLVSKQFQDIKQTLMGRVTILLQILMADKRVEMATGCVPATVAGESRR